METNEDKLQMLQCAVKNYDWGRLDGDSQVARLFSLNSGSEPEPKKPYAEFWMGTHDSGPSFVVTGDENETLKSWLLKNPHVLGEKVLEKWGSDLPFLFKVLSVAKALSIQAHPDKELARTLHKLHPHLYKDGNHKPEMALAITEFEALCGFVPLEELKVVLRTVPEVMDLVGFGNVLPIFGLTDQDGEETVKRELASVFTQIMCADKDKVTEVVGRLISRLNKESEGRELTDKEKLVLRLEEQYPDDIGVIASFLFNYVKLNPGEALSLGANEPHAYINGECIECMATSDNVVRAGLTPKYRDVQTLCSMLTYKQGPPEILRGTVVNAYVTKYLPPFDEFEIDRCVLPMGEKVTFPAVPGPSIFLVMDGEAIIEVGGSMEVHIVAEGDVIFAAANTEVKIRQASDLILYRAGVNTKFFQTS
ncbi:hypothetical protein QN277_001093 [Acacia crassicarpa]|uniref:mannose-6-phosphate isomerase n=1 Tax=Acacia crassicarpa TaxID=499986 RepID=A0AAE1N805_9FABA|nr:hypothetical protein QN277_001093 [Acacia crassicarpa]